MGLAKYWRLQDLICHSRSLVRELDLIGQLYHATMAGNEVHIDVRVGVMVMMLFHQVFLIDELHTKHVSSMSMMKSDIEPANTVCQTIDEVEA